MNTPAHTHLMLVYEQAAPNLLPALDSAMKPKEAVLLVSQRDCPSSDSPWCPLSELALQAIGLRRPQKPLRQQGWHQKPDTLRVEGLANFVSDKLALQAISLRVPCGSLPCKR